MFMIIANCKWTMQVEGGVGAKSYPVRIFFVTHNVYSFVFIIITAPNSTLRQEMKTGTRVQERLIISCDTTAANIKKLNSLENIVGLRICLSCVSFSLVAVQVYDEQCYIGIGSRRRVFSMRKSLSKPELL